MNAWFLKRFKRRPLVMTSGIGMAVVMIISGTFTKWIKDGTWTANTRKYMRNIFFYNLFFFFSLTPERHHKSRLGTGCLFAPLCLLFDDWTIDNSVDHDSWTISKRNSWYRPFDFIFDGKYLDVLRHSSLSVIFSSFFLSLRLFLSFSFNDIFH